MRKNLKDFKKEFILASFVIVLTIFIAISSSIFETNDKGQFQVKQAAISGKMSVITKPGTYFQLFGDITTWNKAETFYFTADLKEGALIDQSIEVRFVDGSMCNISGTMRITLPSTEKEILHLVEDLNFTTYDELKNKLIMPTVRSALRLTANFMTVRESYAEKRADYSFWVWDQIQNGLYKTRDEQREVLDPATGTKTMKTFKVVAKDKKGVPLYTKNPLRGTGIILSNFEIKKFVYSDTVAKQITDQQKLYMSIATARAEADKAQQDKIKEEAKGKADVARAEAQALVLKKRAVVEAEKLKEVAELEAKKKFEVAKYAAKEALEEAKKIEAEGRARAAANRALVAAGLTPLEKAHIEKDTAIGVARELAKASFPKIIVSGKGGNLSPLEAVGFNQMFDLVKKMSGKSK